MNDETIFTFASFIYPPGMRSIFSRMLLALLSASTNSLIHGCIICYQAIRVRIFNLAYGNCILGCKQLLYVKISGNIGERNRIVSDILFGNDKSGEICFGIRLFKEICRIAKLANFRTNLLDTISIPLSQQHFVQHEKVRSHVFHTRLVRIVKTAFKSKSVIAIEYKHPSVGFLPNENCIF